MFKILEDQSGAAFTDADGGQIELISVQFNGLAADFGGADEVKKALQEWVRDNIHQDCYCSHDCCGHRFTQWTKIADESFTHEDDEIDGVALILHQTALNY